MKKALFILFLFFMSAASVCAQTAKAKVEAAVETLRKAMISGNKSELQKIADDSLSYGHSHGNVQDKAAFVESIASGKSDFVTIELSNQTISVNGDVAVVRHLLQADTNDNNKPGKVKLAVLLIFKEQKGQWKLLARQAVKPAE